MNDLEELKTLLFGAEKETLEHLDERVRKPETRSVDIADVLPEAVRLSHRAGDELAVELREPVRRCLKESIQETPQEYADALYPVMGPAIRKSIVETLKAFVQQISQTVDYSLSAKGLKWRFQAARAGIPFGEFVLQQSLLYRVEQAYLTSRNNGLLVAHVHHEASRIKDSDAVSAMFTAIQDFVKESFSPDRTGRLEVADMGEFSLWAVHGPHALLVCVIRGVPPSALRADMSRILERIHFRFGESIRTYAGDTASMEGVESELNECLQFQAQHKDVRKKSRISMPMLIVLLAIAGVVAYFAFERWSYHQEHSRLSEVVRSIPGMHISGITYDNEQFTLHGLRDPLAMSIPDLAGRAGLDETHLVSDLRPYRSLEPEIARLRLHGALAAPASVSVIETGDGFVVSGQASQKWIDNLQTVIAINASNIPITIGDLESEEWLELEKRVAQVSGTQFRFFLGKATLFPNEAVRLQEYAADLREIVDSANRLNGTIKINVTGFTDAPGTMEINTALSGARAVIGVDALLNANIGRSHINIVKAETALSSVDVDPGRRRISISVHLASR